MSKLGTKENGLFKTAIQLYENKQYKRGLKTCEQILKKYPEHGETLALKGLFLLFTEKREEGFETCKKGLKLSIQSHISWHILGLMHRQDKNYEEAIKCYKNALKIDKDNFQILRDLGLLQLQCRQLEGAIETRKKIIFSRPSSPFNWISMVVVCHISGDLKQALDILNIYLGIFGKIHDPSENHKYYKVSIIVELGLPELAIDYLESSFQDKKSRRYYEALADALLLSKNYSRCESIIWKLIEINPDCREYIIRLFNLYLDQSKDVSHLYDLIKEKSILSAIELLSLLNFEVFKSKLPSTFSEIMERESPATFQLFKSSLETENRKSLIWECLQRMDQTKISVIMFKIKYLSYINDYDSALEQTTKAIELYPESNDLMLLKAHVLKKLKLNAQSLEVISNMSESASTDKFCASKIAKYMIRNGSISDAQNILGKFIQKPDQTERMNDLHEMQAAWYLNEMGDRLFNNGDFLKAACFYRKVMLIFDEILDDQLDFHGYSLRRMSFEEYIKFLRFLDHQLKKSHYLKTALIGMSSCLLKISVETDLDLLTSKLAVSNISSEFSENIDVHLKYFQVLFSNPKDLREKLNSIFAELLFNHSNHKDSLEAALNISIHLKSMISAQKIVSKLSEMRINVSNEVIDAINNSRSEFWSHIPPLSLLNETS